MYKTNYFESINVHVYVSLLIAVLLSFNKLLAQIPPSNPLSGWQLQPALSDGFNSPLYPQNLTNNICQLTTNKWFPNGFGESNQPWDYTNNIIIDNGNLRLIFTGNNANPGPAAPSPFPAYNSQSWPYNNISEWWFANGEQTCDWRTGCMYSNPWYDVNGPIPLPCPLPAGYFPPNPINYLFGYFEIYAKLPGYKGSGQPPYNTNIYDQNGMSTGGINPLWWFSGEVQKTCDNDHTCTWDEVDVMEGNGFNGGDVRPNTISTHWNGIANCLDDGTCFHSGISGVTDIVYHPQVKVNEVDMDVDVVNQYHKYGFEWMPDRLVFYFDDVPYFTNYNAPGIPQHPMAMQLGMSINTPASLQQFPQGLIEQNNPNVPIIQHYDPNNPNTMAFVIDYFHYYKMQTNNCYIDYQINNNIDLANFPAEVRQNVNVGFNGSVVMNSNSTQIIRHSGDFTVKNLLVPIGSELTVLHTPCQ